MARPLRAAASFAAAFVPRHAVVAGPLAARAPLLRVATFTTSTACRGMEEFFPPIPKEGQVLPKAGRAWAAAELRLKSFEDLHKLWFVCLKERNMLLSERLYFKQVGQAAPDAYRLRNCKKTMAMIQVVLGERRRAAEAYGAEVERQATAAAAAAAGGPPAPAPAVRLVPPTPEDARALDARAAAAAAVKLKYSGAKVTIKKFGRRIEVPAESDAALTPTRQARRVESKRRTFLTKQRALRAQLEATEAATHGPEAIAAAKARAIATPPIRRRRPEPEAGARRGERPPAPAAVTSAAASVAAAPQ